MTDCLPPASPPSSPQLFLVNPRKGRTSRQCCLEEPLEPLEGTSYVYGDGGGGRCSRDTRDPLDHSCRLLGATPLQETAPPYSWSQPAPSDNVWTTLHIPSLCASCIQSCKGLSLGQTQKPRGESTHHGPPGLSHRPPLAQTQCWERPSLRLSLCTAPTPFFPTPVPADITQTSGRCRPSVTRT